MRTLTKLTCGFALAVGTVASQAGSVTGNLWRLPEASTYTAAPGAVPGSTPDVVFTSPTPFSYSFGPGPIGTWLGSGGASGIVENTPGTLAATTSDFTTGMLVDFKGCIDVVKGDAFTFTHDDGMYLSINGMDLGFLAAPTAPYTETQYYTGPSGHYAFELVYTENNSGPAVLWGGSSAFEACPDGGSTMALFSGAMLLVGSMKRKFSA